MCLMLFFHDCHPRYHLVLLANRDEFYRRPTAPLGFWEDAPHVLAGRDLRAMGTWLGITTNGRWAGLTNYRDPSVHIENGLSRGKLVADFLLGEAAPADYLKHLASLDERINGYNLIAGDAKGIYYHSSRASGVRKLAPGVYGVSNHLLNTPWPKVKKGIDALSNLLAREEQRPELEEYFALLADPARFPDHLLPDTGVGLEWERALAPLFIVSPEYGTRSSAVILMDRQGRVTVAERTYGAAGTGGGAADTRRIDFDVSC